MNKQFSIAYVIPYFGNLRNDFKVWLESCRWNPDIDFLIFTDDETQYDYPNNVHVSITTFTDLKVRIQSFFDFPITLNRPYKLVDYKVAYGEIFEEELKKYAYWGYCDMDMMWGGVRQFFTNDVLLSYEKIGFQGHSTVYSNTEENRKRYRTIISGIDNYVDVFQSERIWNFDENGINHIYMALGVKIYSETTFSTLAQYRHNFVTRYWPKEIPNRNNIFIWKSGRLYQVSVTKKGSHSTELMYVHWQKRSIEIESLCDGADVLIYPNKIVPYSKGELSYQYVKGITKNRWFSYLIQVFRKNGKNGFVYNLKYIRRFIKYNWMVAFHNEEKPQIQNKSSGIFG